MIEQETLMNLCLAPLGTRRRMAILGFLHRVVLGLTTIQICNVFPLAAVTETKDQISARVRVIRQKHNNKFVDWINAKSSEQSKRNIVGMIKCYNGMP